MNFSFVYTIKGVKHNTPLNKNAKYCEFWPFEYWAAKGVSVYKPHVVFHDIFMNRNKKKHSL